MRGTSVRETCVSGNHAGAPVEGHPENLRTIQHYCIEGFLGGPSFGPQIMPRDASVSNSRCKFFFPESAAELNKQRRIYNFCVT